MVSEREREREGKRKRESGAGDDSFPWNHRRTGPGPAGVAIIKRFSWDTILILVGTGTNRSSARVAERLAVPYRSGQLVLGTILHFIFIINAVERRGAETRGGE